MPKQLSVRLSDWHWKALRKLAERDGVGVHVALKAVLNRQFGEHDPDVVTSSSDDKTDVITSASGWIPVEEKTHSPG